ncbi:hypothetical protein GE253_25110 [Niveispirillum sp. SYP-B3756]|uniref:Rpn family recombination-promoting nuclease/putative transposase n=1 Tax=Niveispirillum sp. SYP-B3756 TaxID=2662178 RepID=UPI00129225C0|nr:Rpn family recombination-promoting nuclease/putative transposase [Niveispirillum sp. SYP-B3756]MQP68597.1 hypothetical protein [Niveispirillum sp. SYP-B3756]
MNRLASRHHSHRPPDRDMPSRPIQRHDQFFQTLPDKPGMAGTLLRERLPGSFVSQRLRAYRIDRLYKTKTVTGRPVPDFALIEQKSKPEPHIALHSAISIRS